MKQQLGNIIEKNAYQSQDNSDTESVDSNFNSSGEKEDL